MSDQNPTTEQISNPSRMAALAQGYRVAIPWACYLGCSWTWVIGMFLPSLLLRDYGIWGWVAFAAPNVIGAAAMGFVLANPDASRRLVEKHGDACRWFTEITIAFHLFAIVWLFGRMNVMPWPAVAAGLAVMMLTVAMRSRLNLVTLGTIAVTLVSAAAFWATKDDALAWRMTATPRLTSLDLWLFLPASITGFALCPYLDLTFHRARQSTSPNVGKAAFAVGFGIVFFFMIGFSLVYAGWLGGIFTSDAKFTMPAAWALPLTIHWAIQAGLTVGLHVSERRMVPTYSTQQARLIPLLLLLIAGALIYKLGIPAAQPMSTGEVIYRSLLLTYGTVFPAYVWLCVIPTRKPVSTQAKLMIFAIACVLAYPMAFVGFVVGHAWWIAGSMATLLAARAVIELLPAQSQTN